SAVRARLLAAAGVAFEVVVARVDEETVKKSLHAEGVAPRDLAVHLAELKAQKVSNTHPDALVIGADQVLVFRGEIVGKSSDMGAARKLLRRLAGDVHELIASVVLAKDGVVVWRHVARAEMHTRKFSD